MSGLCQKQGAGGLQASQFEQATQQACSPRRNFLAETTDLLNAENFKTTIQASDRQTCLFLRSGESVAGLENPSRPVNGYYLAVLKCGDPYWLQGRL